MSIVSLVIAPHLIVPHETITAGLDAKEISKAVVKKDKITQYSVSDNFIITSNQ